MSDGVTVVVGVFDLRDRAGLAFRELLDGGCGPAAAGVVWAEGGGVGGAGGLGEEVARAGGVAAGLARLGVADPAYYAAEAAAGRCLVLTTAGPDAARSAFGRHGGSVRVPACVRDGLSGRPPG